MTERQSPLKVLDGFMLSGKTWAEFPQERAERCHMLGPRSKNVSNLIKFYLFFNFFLTDLLGTRLAVGDEQLDVG